MKLTTWNRRGVIAAALALGALCAGPATATQASIFERPDLTVTLERGDAVTLVGGPGSLGGTSAPTYSAFTGRYLGEFVTEISAGPNVIQLLGDALSDGAARAAAVDLTLELGRGTLREQHTANVAVLAEPPSEGYDVVFVVVGEGIVQPDGTGIYEDASGTSSLHIVFEFDTTHQMPPVVRSGTLRFDID